MTDFTYEIPNEEDYFSTLLKLLEVRGEKELRNLLEGAECSIYTTNNFSESRWNAMWTKIQFAVPIERLDPPKEQVEKLRKICDELIPAKAGFDIMKIEFIPMITATKIEDSPRGDLDKTTEAISKGIMQKILPKDIKDKGREMSRAYLYLYCVENTLRLFVDSVSKKQFGDHYFDKLQMRNEIRDSVTKRKQEENKNKWIRVRGDSDIFYVDFDDLGSIIQNNWQLFSTYFPSQQWILAKIEELTKCRNLVAHNSTIGEHEMKMIAVYLESILRQLGETFGK